MPCNKQTQCYFVFAKPSVTLPILVEEYQIMVNRPFNICLVIFRFNLDGVIHKLLFVHPQTFKWEMDRIFSECRLLHTNHCPFSFRLTGSHLVVPSLGWFPHQFVS